MHLPAVHSDIYRIQVLFLKLLLYSHLQVLVFPLPCITNKLYPSSTPYSSNTSCSFCLFLHIFLPSLCSPFQKHSAILLHKMSFRLHIINDVSIQPVPCFLLSFLQNMHAHLYHHSVPDETQLQAGCPVWQPQPFHLLQPVSLLFHKHRQYTVHG